MLSEQVQKAGRFVIYGIRIDSRNKSHIMPQNDEMNTLSEIMNKLTRKGYDKDFRWTKEGFLLEDKIYQPEDLTILKTYRFEGASDPSDMSILYLIQADDGLIGYSLDAYGVYSNHDDEEGYDNFIRQIPVKNNEEQILFEL
jgi:hypothetical protein